MIRMKSTRSFMFLICPIMVLIFLYYSSGRLHLRTSVQKSQAPLDSLLSVGRVVVSEYDKQGFVTKLDRKLFLKPAPMFLDPNFKRLSKISIYPPPFGVRTQEKIIDHILLATNSYSLGSELDSLSCKKCIIIGNGGILFNKSLGSKIDQYDVVVRLNEAPVAGFEKDVGRKTSMRITYPEGAIQKPERYEKSSLFVFSAFKPMDFKWLRHMVYQDKLRSMEGFWKSVARIVPREPEDMRILNPYFIQEAAFRFIGLPHNKGLMGRGNIPTLGTVAITMALHNCDEVAVAGFGYDMDSPRAPLHYYEKLKMSAIKESWTHNISKEKEFLRKLVMGGVIQDLTNGI
ncbi:ST3 beta-galactoside alpha-2,3-sialyltransferase 3a isoform X3 [Rhinichthys klamathensis goyatoka]|uniref:ST3 beta-galactoside alpha-2,3-sialyltransferase 3a isoform X3 n=1 Tax=Rhinichthys klamathensis goyatoka TaxID=3034132 RepID=UPI0024B4BFBC|nr:ST3 beta-galactoside alpha-2,3-sialyltransferase 3a isoform X3 [Rhinichthys klamathensis goyatoka]